MHAIDLNADLGEEVTDDDGLLAVVTSANVACGFHAGGPAVMRAVCLGAVERGVAVGAQVSYADREGFGRRELEVPYAVLAQQVAEQVAALSDAASAAGTTVSYVKPHGALYHRCSRDPEQAAAVLEGSRDLPVLGMRGSVLLDLARDAGRRTVLEGFADRAYRDGRLVDRSEPGAVLTDPADVTAQAVRLAAEVGSVCVHGDTPGAVGHARAVRHALEAAGYAVRAPWAEA